MGLNEPNSKYLLIKKLSLYLKESTKYFFSVRNENGKEGTSCSQARENHYNQRMAKVIQAHGNQCHGTCV